MSRDRVRIAIDLPLPLDVAGTLTTLVGTAYPSAVIRTDTGSGRQLVLEVDDRDRKRLPGKKRVADELKQHEPDDPTEQGDLTKIDSEGWSFRPAEEVMVALGTMVKRVLDETPDDSNYLEWSVYDADDRSKVYVLSAARSKEQTPHALRRQAEAKLDALRALADQWEQAEATARDEGTEGTIIYQRAANAIKELL